jgi:hypothetical protein
MGTLWDPYHVEKPLETIEYSKSEKSREITKLQFLLWLTLPCANLHGLLRKISRSIQVGVRNCAL